MLLMFCLPTCHRPGFQFCNSTTTEDSNDPYSPSKFEGTRPFCHLEIQYSESKIDKWESASDFSLKEDQTVGSSKTTPCWATSFQTRFSESELRICPWSLLESINARVCPRFLRKPQPEWPNRMYCNFDSLWVWRKPHAASLPEVLLILPNISGPSLNPITMSAPVFLGGITIIEEVDSLFTTVQLNSSRMMDPAPNTSSTMALSTRRNVPAWHRRPLCNPWDKSTISCTG